MLFASAVKACGEVDVARFVGADFKQNRQLQAPFYVLGFFAVLGHFYVTAILKVCELFKRYVKVYKQTAKYYIEASMYASS